jgi:hypothetical protein
MNPAKRLQSADEAKNALENGRPKNWREGFSVALRRTMPFPCRHPKMFARKAIIGGAIAGILAAVVAVGIPVLRPAVPLAALGAGTWAGTLHMFGNTGYYKNIKLTIKAGQLHFESALKECPHGDIDSRSGIIGCPQLPFLLRLESVVDDTANGTLINQTLDDRHPFVLKRK